MMRMISLVLALGAIVWVMMQVTGGGNNDTVVSEGHQQALKKAESLEETLQQDLQDNLRAAEEREY
ncbi:MAG: hypothetical protein ACPG1A_06455 [Halioglobus sp.]